MSSNFTISTLLMKCIQFFAPIAIGACNQPLIDSAHLEDLVVEDRHFAALFVDFPFLKGGNEVSSDCDSLTTVELFLSCLKALVTITNHCHEIAVPIIETEDMMKWNCGLLVHSLHWKQQLQLSRKGSSGEKMLEVRLSFQMAIMIDNFVLILQ